MTVQQEVQIFQLDADASKNRIRKENANETFTNNKNASTCAKLAISITETQKLCLVLRKLVVL